jgi:predicted nucleic acid-binding protein
MSCMSGEPFTLDSNILVCLIDRRDAVKQALAATIVLHAATNDCTLTHQALGVFFNAARQKLRVPAPEVAAMVRRWAVIFPTIGSSLIAVETAVDAAERERLSYWDALLLATASEAGCTIALSEDMQDGYRLGTIVVRNPFAGETLSAAAKQVLGL